jgi:hypothetical protein
VKHVARIGDIIKVRRRYLGSHRRKLADNIKIDLREIVWGNVDAIHSAQKKFKCYGVANTVMNLTRRCNVGI